MSHKLSSTTKFITQLKAAIPGIPRAGDDVVKCNRLPNKSESIIRCSNVYGLIFVAYNNVLIVFNHLALEALFDNGENDLVDSSTALLCSHTFDEAISGIWISQDNSYVSIVTAGFISIYEIGALAKKVHFCLHAVCRN
jgi:hypothetical protein